MVYNMSLASQVSQNTSTSNIRSLKKTQTVLHVYIIELTEPWAPLRHKNTTQNHYNITNRPPNWSNMGADILDFVFSHFPILESNYVNKCYDYNTERNILVKPKHVNLPCQLSYA